MTEGSGAANAHRQRRVITSWHQAEVSALRCLLLLGHEDAALTQSGADGGLDVVASGAVAQVKFTGRPAPRKDLQALEGAAFDHPGQRYFFSYSGYTLPAFEYAEAVDMALYSYSSDGLPKPENDLAADLLRQALRPHVERRIAQRQATADVVTPEPGPRAEPSRGAERTSQDQDQALQTTTPHAELKKAEVSYGCLLVISLVAVAGGSLLAVLNLLGVLNYGWVIVAMLVGSGLAGLAIIEWAFATNRV